MAPVAGGAAGAHVSTALDGTRVHAPRDIDGVAAVLRDAHAAHTTLRITGADGWAHGGPPVRADAVLRLDALAGVEAYEPGDLVITARAGTTLAELDRVTAAHGQRLALDPPALPSATLGATLATASAGPLAHGVGTPRDLVLGLEVVTGRGERLRAGGRVVKNVAGFDLVRLWTGSRGTLGPIVSASMRLRALPAHACTLALRVATPDALAPLAAALRAPTLAPEAVEYATARTAAALGLAARDVVLVRIGGNAAFVRAQRDALARLALADEVPMTVWDALRTLALDAPLAWRTSGPVADVAASIAATCAAVRRTAAGDGHVHASLGRGVVRAMVTAVHDTDRAVLPADGADRRTLLETAPAEWWAARPDAFDTPLARRVQGAFDPHGICNPREGRHG